MLASYTVTFGGFQDVAQFLKKLQLNSFIGRRIEVLGCRAVNKKILMKLK